MAFVLAMLVGEGLHDALGYDAAAPAIPVSTVLLAGVPALPIVIAPGVAAASTVAGVPRWTRRGCGTAWIGVTTVVPVLAVNLAALVVGHRLARAPVARR